MKIRPKLLFIILPVLAGSLVLVGAAAYTLATRAVTRIASDFLDFKAFEIRKYAESQWNLLLENNLVDRLDLVKAAQAGVASFAQTVTRKTTESVFALGPTGSLEFQTLPSWEPAPADPTTLQNLVEQEQMPGLFSLNVGGKERMAVAFDFAPFNWRVFVTEERAAFFADVENITLATLIIFAAAILLGSSLILFFVGKVTRPIVQVSRVMQKVIETGDLDIQAPVTFNDEVGHMSHTFNLMTKELNRAYSRIKTYALDAVLSQRRERKLRQVFQKFVPQEVIDRFIQNPESMLVGENRELSVLFSDIRSFTSISEAMKPDELVQSLNRYFDTMVELIYTRGGVIDKYIGDAIMAFFGAPVKHDNDAQQSLEAALDMVEALEIFNQGQRERGAPEFKIGIGINYGLVTVGNIGSERKMDYTVIGDMVNLASRLEGQTKPYHEQIIFSEFLQEKVGPSIPTRLLDCIAVKGKKKGVRIYTAGRNLSEMTLKAWKAHNQAMELYYQRRFEEALHLFTRVREVLGEQDYHTAEMIGRCQHYLAHPPAEDWNGVEVKTEK